MKWIELIVHTTSEGSEFVSDSLMDRGASGTMIEDRADIPDPAKPHGIWEIIDPKLLDAMPEDVLVHAWFEPGDSFGDWLRDYTEFLSLARSEHPEYGTLDDFRALVDAIHANGMRCMIDVVYNHTSPDSVLSQTHPEFFYHRPDGSFGNQIGDWSDVIDLDYSSRDLWNYQIETLKYWAGIVDGFRCDVASFVPLPFWKAAREAVAEVRPDCVWLAESVHLSFGVLSRRFGKNCPPDRELYEAFDMEYEYDIREVFDRYIRGETVLSHCTDMLNFQDFA